MKTLIYRRGNKQDMVAHVCDSNACKAELGFLDPYLVKHQDSGSVVLNLWS